MTESLRRGLIVAAFVGLALVAAAGWSRKPGQDSSNVNMIPAVGQAAYPAAQSYAQPVAYDVQGRPVYATGYAGAVPCVEPVSNQASRAVYVSDRQYTTRARRPVRVVREYDDVQVKRKRSTGKSAAIVAGSAGAGAAIGAVAGGGKGAAIGAISGGAAGFVYDRLTHNR